MALYEVTACKYETRNSRGFAVATAADGSHWEYELFEGGDGSEFCRERLRARDYPERDLAASRRSGGRSDSTTISDTPSK